METVPRLIARWLVKQIRRRPRWLPKSQRKSSIRYGFDLLSGTSGTDLEPAVPDICPGQMLVWDSGTLGTARSSRSRLKILSAAKHSGSGPCPHGHGPLPFAGGARSTPPLRAERVPVGRQVYGDWFE